MRKATGVDDTYSPAMRDAAASMLVFGGYLAITGATLLIVPDLLLGILGIPPTEEPWIRILGAVAIALAYYYVDAARGDSRRFMRATVIGRSFVSFVEFGLVIVGLAPPIIVLFGVVELSAAAWTAYALGWPWGGAASP